MPTNKYIWLLATMGLMFLTGGLLAKYYNSNGEAMYCIPIIFFSSGLHIYCLTRVRARERRKRMIPIFERWQKTKSDEELKEMLKEMGFSHKKE